MAIIGREPPADIVIARHEVSARHAEVFHLGGPQYSLRDLSSTNGTFVNGRRIETATVTARDRISLGLHCHFDLADWKSHIDTAPPGSAVSTPPPPVVAVTGARGGAGVSAAPSAAVGHLAVEPSAVAGGAAAVLSRTPAEIEDETRIDIAGRPVHPWFVSPALFALVALCFFLPWVSIGCQGQKLATLTGFQLATGTTVTQPAVSANPGRSERMPAKIPAALALGVVGAGLLAGFVRGRTGLAAGVVAAMTALAALLYMKSQLDGDVAREARAAGLVYAQYEPSYYVVLAVLLVSACWNTYWLCRPERE